MIVLILSDIHGNLEALRSVLYYTKNKYESIVCLGDVIDYGPHSNDVIKILKELESNIPFISNIRGNHEDAIINDSYESFSSDRGRRCAKYTRSQLNEFSWKYLKCTMCDDGIYSFEIDRKHCLAVHGSYQNKYWKAIKLESDLKEYRSYDYVFSGHSHLPHFFEMFYEEENPAYRNKKKTIFINPGSVGQPRNHNSMAQFALLDTDTGEVKMCKVSYDVKKEQADFPDEIDDFYKERLEKGV